MQDIIFWFYNATIPIGSGVLILREVVGNIFGLASALGGMLKKIWAWPVGIIGNILLFFTFVGAIADNSSAPTLLGQAGRQIMFICVSIFGWYRWHKDKKVDSSSKKSEIPIRWATFKERVFIIVFFIGATLVLTPLFRALGSYEPVWSDAWTFVGSLLATFLMAKRVVEFWLVWIAVDAVGVPLLFASGYYATAFMYLFYGVFTAIGFIIWAKDKNKEKSKKN